MAERRLRHLLLASVGLLLQSEWHPDTPERNDPTTVTDSEATPWHGSGLIPEHVGPETTSDRHLRHKHKAGGANIHTDLCVVCVCVLYNNVMERVTFYLLPLWQAEDGNVPHDWVTVSLLLLILAFIKTEWVHLPFMIKGLITACNDGKLLPTCCMLTLLAQRLQGRIQLKKGCHLWKCLCGKNCFPLLICVLIDQYK